MKKLLTTIFMAVVAVSAFAAVSLETIKPDINRNGTCERIGTMKFNITTDGDFTVLTGASVTTAVILKVRLVTDLGRQDVPLTQEYGYATPHDYTSFDWLNDAITVDGTVVTDGHIVARCGEPYFFIRITSTEYGGGAAPGTPGTFTVGDTALSPMTVNPSGLFQINEYLVVAVSDFVATGAYVDVDPYTINWEAEASDTTNTDVDFLGNSYQPADPAVAIARDYVVNAGITITKTCPKPLVDPVIYLCPCYTIAQGEDDSCYDIYRYGDICNLVITEDYLGSLKTGDVIELTLPDGVYWLGSAVPSISDNFADGGVDASIVGWADQYTEDGGATTTFSAYSGENIPSYVVDESDCGDDPARNVIQDTVSYCDTTPVTLYGTLQISVDTASTTEAGTITITGLNVARSTALAPLMDVPVTVTAGIDDPSLCEDCTRTLTDTLDDVADFVACDFSDELEVATAQVYYPYFPNFNVYGTYSWWAGVAISQPHFAYGAPGQPMNVTLYLIEADGDIYMYDWGTVPGNGVAALDLTSITPTAYAVSPTDSGFGDEDFWALAVCEGTIPGMPLIVDGFGMMGDGTQAQGNLARQMMGMMP